MAGAAGAGAEAAPNVEVAPPNEKPVDGAGAAAAGAAPKIPAAGEAGVAAGAPKENVMIP